ncbi:MAG: FAD:protein FMN transferase [Thermoanaerobaculia bacterium]
MRTSSAPRGSSPPSSTSPATWRPWAGGETAGAGRSASPIRAAAAAASSPIRLPGDAGIATSGDYERFFMKDGIRYHHLLDATTGFPAHGVASATVVARTAFSAGLHATAAFLLGEEEGFALLERTPGVEGVLVTEAGAICATTGMWRLAELPSSAYPILSRERFPRSRPGGTDAPAAG